MKQVLLLRHGQSILNLGLAAENDTLAPLTEEGVRQAEQASRDLPFEPELVASSPYRRTIQTAEPIRKRFLQAKWELWNELHEFTYLKPASCTGLTRDERRPRSRAYWQATDPDYIDGEGGGEFPDAHATCRCCLRTLASPPGEQNHCGVARAVHQGIPDDNERPGRGHDKSDAALRENTGGGVLRDNIVGDIVKRSEESGI